MIEPDIVTIKILNYTLITELQCVGCISYWLNLVKFKNLCFEQKEHFQKTGFRNRYQILSASGPLTLSVPIVGGRASRLPIREIIIDNSELWQKHHWRGLMSCYNKSPFFYYYHPYLEVFFSKPYKWLWDFNFELFQWLSNSLRLNAQISFTDTYEKNYALQGIVDARNKFKPSNRLSYQHNAYMQVFGSSFQPNLSLLDILFNLGPQTRAYLENN